MNNLLMQPQNAAPPQAQAPAATPEEIAQARNDVAAMTKHLTSLAMKPKGSLSKEDLYNAAGDMIADGAFGAPQAKQALVAELAQIPDDEAAIRAAVGQHLLFLAHAQDRIHSTWGPGDADA